MIRFALVSALLVAGCFKDPAHPDPVPLAFDGEIVHGPGADAPSPTRVLLVPATCGAIDGTCNPSALAAAENLVRGELELAGMSVVPAAELRKETRQRHVEHSHLDRASSSSSSSREVGIIDYRVKRGSSQSREVSDTQTTILDGPGYEDLSVDDRHEVIGKTGANGVVSIRIVVGPVDHSWVGPERDRASVEVMVKLAGDQGDTMRWGSRCTAQIDPPHVAIAIQEGARCAIRNALAAR